MLLSNGFCILRVLGGDVMVSYVLFYVFFMIYIHFLNALLACLYNRMFIALKEHGPDMARCTT